MKNICKSLVILGMASILAQLPSVVLAQPSPQRQTRADIVNSLRISKSSSSVNLATNTSRDAQANSPIPTTPQGIAAKAMITDQGSVRYNDGVNVRQLVYDITPLRNQIREGDAAIQLNLAN